MSNVMLQCLLGIKCDEFVMVAADQNNSQGIVIIKNDEQKIVKVSDSLMMGVVGDPGQAAQFTQFVMRNVDLYQMKNGYGLSTEAMVHFIRQNLVAGLRTDTPFNLNLILAGFDETGGQLYYLDYVASCIKVPYACHGYGGFLSLGILDKAYKPDLKLSEAYSVLTECVQEIQRRMLINLSSFQVCVIDRNGVQALPIIKAYEKK